MLLDINYRNINRDSHESIREELNKAVESLLEPHVATFNANQLKLHVTLEAKKHGYHVVLRLLLPPKKILIAKENDDNLKKAISGALRELARQAERHHAQVSGREQWKYKKRLQRNKEMRSDIESVPVENQKQLAKNIEPLLSRIDRYIKHELIYLRANGDLLPRYPRLADIRDEALLQFQLHWNELDSQDEALYQNLLKTVYQIFQKEIQDAKLHENDVSLEGEIPEDASDEAEEMVGEEIMGFYQPDESLQLEDLLADSNEALPDEVLDESIRQHSHIILASLPVKWRTVLTLVYQEGIPVANVATNIMSLPLDEVNHLLQQAESYMLDSLESYGLDNLNKNTLASLLKL